jgi:hypothetical protein
VGSRSSLLPSSLAGSNGHQAFIFQVRGLSKVGQAHDKALCVYVFPSVGKFSTEIRFCRHSAIQYWIFLRRISTHRLTLSVTWLGVHVRDMSATANLLMLSQIRPWSVQRRLTSQGCVGLRSPSAPRQHRSVSTLTMVVTRLKPLPFQVTD